MSNIPDLVGHDTSVLQVSHLMSLLMLSPLHTGPPASEICSLGTVLTHSAERQPECLFQLAGPYLAH